MADQPPTGATRPDPVQLAGRLADIAERSQRLMTEWLARNGLVDSRAMLADSLEMAGSFADFTTHMMREPAHLAQAQVSLWQNYMDLWQNTAVRMLGLSATPVYQPTAGDRRFRHPHWRENEIFNYIKQSYLLVSRWLEQTVHDVEGLDHRTRQRVEFYTRQFISAISPSNFAFTNPEVIEATIGSGGENLLSGLRNLLDDLEHGRGALQLVDSRTLFVVGRDLAVTPGKVVLRNELMELIQYSPATNTVFRQPLLVVPPWSNKFYIVDLDAQKSWVRWALQQGHTVFVVSWVNPSGSVGDRGFDDYVRQGPVAALDAIEQATGERDVHAVGYCLGGTLLAVAMAYLAACGDRRIATGSFFATMLDFSEPGELGVFIDEAALACLEKPAQPPPARGDDMVSTINLLRENDLTWSFVVNNYLLGKDSFPVELLFWNADSNRIAPAMQSFYLKTIYRQNKLAERGGVVVDGKPIDLGKITAPCYFLSTREDHITPWRSAYKSMRLVSGPVRFALAGSGHIAGVIDPPDTAGGHLHWVSERTPPADPDSWLSQSSARPGSWWYDWHAWILRHARNERVAAREPGGGALPSVGDAPGTYALMRT